MKILTVILMLISFTAEVHSPAGSEKSVDPGALAFIRQKYYEGVENENAIAELQNFITLEFTSDETEYPPVILAYAGAVEALKSKHASWPVTKLNYFKSSMKLLGRAVKEDPANFEIRFVRYSILHHVPGFLGYSDEKKHDALLLYSGLINHKADDFDYEVKRGIAEMLLESGFMSVEQSGILQKYYPDAEMK